MGLLVFFTQTELVIAQSSQAPSSTEAPTQELAGFPTNIDRGAAVYEEHCSACHMFGLAEAPKLHDAEAWQPELDQGKHDRARLGLILMSTDLASESDFFAMAPEGVAVHITRLKTDDYTTNETLSRHIEHMADAASRIQPDTKPDVVSYGCTSGSIVIGEDRVMAEIRRGAPWAKPMCIVTGVVDALRELNANKIVVGTPYLDEINTAEAEFLTARGFDILDIQGLNLSTGIEFGRVTPAYWTQFALEIDRLEADAIFLSCGGIRALEAAEEIEQKTGKPVVTSNQARFWSCLRRAGIADQIEGFGQIFMRPGSTIKERADN